MDTLPANGASNCFARVASGSVPVCTRIRASENRPVSNYRTVGRTPGRTPGLHLQLASGRNPEENTAMHPPPHVPCFASLLPAGSPGTAGDQVVGEQQNGCPDDGGDPGGQVEESLQAVDVEQLGRSEEHT